MVNYSPDDEEVIKVAEAKRIIDSARERGVILKLIGGLAVRIHCVITFFCEREYLDIDFVGLSKHSEAISRLFEDLGYKENRNVWLTTGGNQKQFYRESLEDHVDVFLDFLRMEHDIDLRERLNIEDYTISISDLLLSKIQIFELNEKDVRDILTLVKDVPLGETDDKGVINVKYIAEICARNWGLYHDVIVNIDKCVKLMSNYNLTLEEKEKIKAKLDKIKETIEKTPKTTKWKLRAKIGEHMPWRRKVEEQRLAGT